MPKGTSWVKATDDDYIVTQNTVNAYLNAPRHSNPLLYWKEKHAGIMDRGRNYRAWAWVSALARKDRDTLIEQSVALIKQSWYFDK